MSTELWALLAGQRDEAVDTHLESDRFDPLALHPEHQVPPLVALIAHGLNRLPNQGIFPRADKEQQLDLDMPDSQAVQIELKVLARAKQMVDAGADLNQRVPAISKFAVEVEQCAQSYYEYECEFDYGGQVHNFGDLEFRDPTYEELDDDERLLQVPVSNSFWESVPCAGHSAMSLATAIREQLRCAEGMRCSREELNDSHYPEIESVWLRCCRLLDALLQCFDEAARHAPAPERVRVAESVVARWEAFLAASESHDLTLVCARDKTVTAHARMLALSSPVLATMLSSPLIEGQTKSIPLPDCPAVAARLFLDLLYTGSSTAETDTEATMLDALRLSHRWGVQPLVDMLERALTRQLTSGLSRATFEDLAEAAQVLELPALRRACKLYVAGDVNISQWVQGRQGTKPRPAVIELFAPPPPATASSGTTGNKRRRVF